MSNDRKDLREAKTAADKITSQPSQRRRRLVKGALSAPVFLTLQNGSVFANTSNDATVATQKNIQDAVAYMADNRMNILCVHPLEGVTQEGTDRYDFGAKFQCVNEPILTNGTDEELLQSRLAALSRCESNNGYIIAGSSHASICH